MLTIPAWLAIMPWLPTMPCCCCCCMRVYGLVALMGYCNEGCWGDTFMSRDTLLTGRPLPGWPGRTLPKSEDRNKGVLAKCAVLEKSINKIAEYLEPYDLMMVVFSEHCKVLIWELLWGGNPGVHVFFFQVSVELTRWAHASPDAPVLLLCCHGGIGLGHLQDIIDDVLFVHGTGQRNRPRLTEELRLSILQVVQDVIQLRRLERAERGKVWKQETDEPLRPPFRNQLLRHLQTHKYTCDRHTHLLGANLVCKHYNTCMWSLYLGDGNSRLGLVYTTAVTPG